MKDIVSLILLLFLFFAPLLRGVLWVIFGILFAEILIGELFNNLGEVVEGRFYRGLIIFGSILILIALTYLPQYFYTKLNPKRISLR